MARITFVGVICLLLLFTAIMGVAASRTAPNQEETKEEKTQRLKGVLRKNLAQYGVSNHGISMDEIKWTKAYSSQQIGIGIKKYDKRKI